MTAMPAIVDRETWQAEIDALRTREKAIPVKATSSPQPVGDY